VAAACEKYGHVRRDAKSNSPSPAQRRVQTGAEKANQFELSINR